MKKILGFLFLTLILASIMTLSASSEGELIVASGNCGKDITWTIYDRSDSAMINYHLVFEGSGSIFGYNKDGSYTSYSTRNDSQFADYKDYIITAEIGEGITSVGNFGLAFLPALERVELSSTVDAIKAGAFENCTALISLYRAGEKAVTGIDLTGITSIGNYAFDGCGAVTRIYFDPAFSGTINTESFKNTSIITLVIPEGVTEISKKAFYSCDNLQYIQIKGDPVIAEDAFQGIKQLVRVYGNKGSSAEALAQTFGAEFSTGDFEETQIASKDAIAFGNCGDEVYWQILNEGTNEEPVYIFDVYGTGTTMEALNSSGEEITYNNQNELLWISYVPYIKKARVGGEVTTLANCALAFLKQVEYIELSPKVIYLKDKVFESNSNMKAVYITGGEPVDGVADLSNILTHGSFQFDGCKKINTVLFSEDMQDQQMKSEFLKGTGIVDFSVPRQFNYISYDAFENCKSLTTLRFFGNPEIAENALHWCTKLEKIYGISGGYAEAYANAHGIEFVSPLEIKIYLDGELLAETGAVEGSTLGEPLFGGGLYMLYKDEALTQPYVLSQKIYEDMTLYASPLLLSSGFMVRSEDYHGLRAIYKFGFEEIKGNDAYDIIEIGALASGKRGVRITDLNLKMNFIHTTAVVKENSFTGLLASAPVGNLGSFAFTAVGFEDEEGSLVASRAAEELYLRGYAILRDKASGREYTFYTDIASASLIEKCKSTAETGKDFLSPEKLDFINTAADIEAEERPVYTRDELMAALEKIYNEKESYIVGQHSGFTNEDTFAGFIENFYNETGDIPGVVALDQGTMNLSGQLTDGAREILTADLIEYAKMGGIFSLSFHMDHPRDASLYCRGELGGEEVWEELMTEGTELNNALMASLETAARTLQDLEDAGVPVLFRPLHEMNGGWFWWCIIQTVDGETRALDADYFVRLWRYFYNYFEVQCDLDNLIWVYSPNFTNSTTSPVPVMYCYPGDEYVDIVGCDWYTSYASLSDIEGAGKSYSSVAATGKIAAMTEYGLRNSLASNSPAVQEKLYNCMDELETYRSLLDAGFGVTYVLNWSGASSAYLNLGKAAEYMAAPETLGASDVLDILKTFRNSD